MENEPAPIPLDYSNPKRVHANSKWLSALGYGATVTLTAGGLVAVLLPSMNRTMGSTRSARLQWQQRQCEIQQAINQQSIDKASVGEKPTDQQ